MARKRDEFGATYADTKYNYKGVEVDLVQDDIGAVLQMGINGIKQYGGTPPKYDTNEKGLNLFKEKTIQYLEHIKSVNLDENMTKKVVADIEGWCVFLGITRNTLSKYYNNRGSEWKYFIDYAKEIIATTKKQNAMTYRTPPMIAVFDLVNNHSYHNSNEFKLVQETSADTDLIQGKPIARAIADSGLMYDEETGEFLPMGDE